MNVQVFPGSVSCVDHKQFVQAVVDLTNAELFLGLMDKFEQTRPNYMQQIDMPKRELALWE